jgi:hypothetical protein
LKVDVSVEFLNTYFNLDDCNNELVKQEGSCCYSLLDKKYSKENYVSIIKFLEAIKICKEFITLNEIRLKGLNEEKIKDLVK